MITIEDCKAFCDAPASQVEELACRECLPLVQAFARALEGIGLKLVLRRGPALVAIVVGSTATGWLGTLQARGVDYAFWIGNQGLEFTSMGRV